MSSANIANLADIGKIRNHNSFTGMSAGEWRRNKHKFQFFTQVRRSQMQRCPTKKSEYLMHNCAFRRGENSHRNK